MSTSTSTRARPQPSHPDEVLQLRQQLSRSRARTAELQQTLVAVQSAERERLAQLVHDDLGQYLVAIRAQLAVLGLTADAAMQPGIAALAHNCQELQNGFRTLLNDLPREPGDLSELLPELAARWQRDHGITCRVHAASPLPALAAPAFNEIRLLLQEALTNVARHAKAGTVRIRLQQRGAHLYLLLTDDGNGTQASSAGVGLQSMRRRARELGGDLHIARRRGRGWTLLLRLPMEKLL